MQEGLDAETGRQQHRIGTDGGNRRGGQGPSPAVVPKKK
jgi:hypothetical protein